MTTREELEALTKQQIIEQFGLEADKGKVTKENLIDLALRAQRKEPDPTLNAAVANGDAEMLTLLLDDCTFTFRDAGGLVHTLNPGKAHTVALAGFPEATKQWPAEWADFGGGEITVDVDGQRATSGRLYHANERKGV